MRKFNKELLGITKSSVLLGGSGMLLGELGSPVAAPLMKAAPLVGVMGTFSAAGLVMRSIKKLDKKY